MIIDCYSGTPHMGEEKRHTRPADAKKWVLDRVDRQAKKVAKFDGELARRLASVRQEIDSVSVAGLPLKETRVWSATDEHTGVTFTFKITRMSS